MKDSEFIELLNLYLDHEISAADAARLEAEVHDNPARRRVYQQYCRIQKACKLVVADFQAEAENAPADGDRKVVPFDPAAIATAAMQRKRMSGFYTVGTFAAVAACVAIIFVGRSRQSDALEQASTSASPMAHAPAPVNTGTALQPLTTPPAVSRGLVAVTPQTQSRAPQRSLLAGDHSLLLSGTGRTDAFFTAAVSQTSDQLKWIENVKLAPLQQRSPADEFRFEGTLQPAMGTRISSPNKPREEAEEMVTFLISNK